MGSIAELDTVPMVDVSAFANKNSNVEEREAAGKAFAAAVHVHGYAGITGHGLEESELKEIFAMMKRLFDLPMSEKMKAPHPKEPVPHRGYSSSIVESGKYGSVFGKSEEEKAFLAKAVDFKETYEIGHEENEEQRNIWLPEDVLPEFRPFMVKAYTRLSEIARLLLEVVMASLELSAEDREAMRQLHEIFPQIRLAHYLPMSQEKQKDPFTVRLAAHKDFSSFTLLFQEPETRQTGLEYENRETGEYMPAPPQPGVLYFNTGTMLERYSNGFYPSSLHRVSIPTVKNADGTISGRYSIPYFCGLGNHTPVYPMPSRVKIDGKQEYDSMPNGELVQYLFSKGHGRET